MDSEGKTYNPRESKLETRARILRHRAMIKKGVQRKKSKLIKRLKKNAKAKG